MSDTNTNSKKKPDLKSLGRINYEGYNEITGYKNFRGEDVPQFPDLPDKIKKAWEQGADRVREAVIKIFAPARVTSILDDFKALELRLKAQQAINPSVGRQIAIAITNLETAKLFYKAALELAPKITEPQV